MKHIKTLLLLTTIFFASNTYAQNSSGYFGKRFVAGYQFQIAPSSDIRTDGFLLGKKHFFTLDYALKDRYSIGIKVGKYSNTIKDINSIDAEYNSHNVNYNGGSIGLKTTQITISNKFFKSKHGSIAPYGRYTLLNIGLLSTKADFTKLQLSYSDNTSYKNIIDVSTYSQNHTDIILEYGWGNQKILFDNFVIGYGIDFSIPLNSYIGALKEARNLRSRLTKTAQRRLYKLHGCDIFIEARYLF